MEITYKNKEREDEALHVGHINIILNDDVEFVISVNQFNELVVIKNQYGEGEGCIILKPSVSNEIRLL